MLKVSMVIAAVVTLVVTAVRLELKENRAEGARLERIHNNCHSLIPAVKSYDEQVALATLCNDAQGAR